MTTSEGPHSSTPDGADPPARNSATGKSGYEFSARENRVLANLASSMQFVGLFGVAIGVLVVVSGFLSGTPWPILSGAFYAVLGLWTHRAGVSFRDVVKTEGHDIGHLMQGIDDLRKLFNVQYWICLLALLIAIGLVVGTLLRRTG